MYFTTELAARAVSEKLALLFDDAVRDTGEAIGSDSIPVAVAHFAKLRDAVSDLGAKMSALNKLVDQISHELLPTMFQNQNVTSINVDDVGRVTVVDRWSASMLDKGRGFEWLRSTGNGGLIQETVHPQTLAAFARAEAEMQRPLPSNIFKANPTPHISITKA